MKMDFVIQTKLQMELPNDIIFSILKRLPVKTLLRFMCVSKNWNSIIRSSTFILNYSFSPPQSYFYIHLLLNSPKQKSYGLFCDATFSVISKVDIPSSFFTSAQSSIVLGSCKGLFCLTHPCFFGHKLFLWNPSIRKHKILPTSSMFVENFHQKFNVGKISTRAALGFDSITNDYKVLRLLLFGSKFMAEMYSLSLDSWQRVGLQDNLMNNLIMIHPTKYVYIDGAIHWLAEFLNNGKSYSSILRFEVSEERFGEMEMPNIYMNGILRGIEHKCLTVYKGLLALLIYGYDYELVIEGRDYAYYLWTLNKNIWTKQRVGFEEMGLCECIGDHLIGDNYSDGKLYMFDPQSSERKTPVTPHPGSIHAFTESLTLL